MRRLYVAPRDTFFEMSALFHRATGGHFYELGGGLVVVSADFDSEAAEEAWESHPEVALLPHPVYEGNVKIKDKIGDPVKKLKPKHLEALGAIGVTGEDNVVDVSNKANKYHPLVKIRHLG